MSKPPNPMPLYANVNKPLAEIIKLPLRHKSQREVRVQCLRVGGVNAARSMTSLLSEGSALFTKPGSPSRLTVARKDRCSAASQP